MNLHCARRYEARGMYKGVHTPLDFESLFPSLLWSALFFKASSDAPSLYISSITHIVITNPLRLIMASTQMMHSGPQLSQAHSSTPPDSPSLPPGSQAFTVNDVHKFIEMVKATVAMQIAPTAQSPHSVTLEHIEQLFMKLIQSKDSAKASDGAEPGAKPRDAQPKGARASKLEFKTVNEMYVFS
jgi:hypothetical protein